MNNVVGARLEDDCRQVVYLNQEIPMALKDITRIEVEKAIDEYDDKGRNYMFREYGGRPSKEYHIEYEGICYPQKLITRAAHGFLPGKAPMKARRDGANGTKTRKHLEKLGFTIISHLRGRI